MKILQIQLQCTNSDGSVVKQLNATIQGETLDMGDAQATLINLIEGSTDESESS